MKNLLILSGLLFIQQISGAQCPAGTFPAGPNLITNGDFSSGNAGFSSSYIYTTSQGGCNVANHYAIGIDPGFYNAIYQGAGNGNFLIANGAQGSVWCQTVTVEANTYYNFSAWITSLTTINPALLQFTINGQQICSDFPAPGNLYSWQQFQCSWFSGNDTTATICITDITGALEGNDFGC